HRNPVPIDVVGELYIGGPGVANGYLNRPDLTAERFLPDPFNSVPGARMYKTGDLVRYLPGGNIVYMGRNDDQVKIRGFRIELGEIEKRLAEHPDVREVIVLAAGEGSQKRLIAYVASSDHESPARSLRNHLSGKLPEYMIPSAFVRLTALPLTSNGKVDRRALPEPDSNAFVTGDYIAPEGEFEVALAGIWAEVLQIERVGRHDNFFTMGGHSLLAVRMINNVKARLGTELKLNTLFTAPTITELSLELQHGPNSHDDEYGVLLPLKPQGNRPPLFCIHPALGLSWPYIGLAKHLHLEQPLYGLQARGLDGKSPLAGSVEEMTLDYIDQIRKIQPHGPYHLLGWSFGGTVAHNIAVQLEKQGEQVPLLVIMDSRARYSMVVDHEMEELEGAKHVEHLARFSGKDSLDHGWELWKRVVPININNINVATRFTPSVYSGDILFFRATVPQEEDAPLADPASWKPYALGEVEVHDVECMHIEMDKPGNIAQIGGVIAKKFEKLQ
ncbi:hypothetical protein BGX28_008193, partial [Mortierella sp. GBA30]